MSIDSAKREGPLSRDAGCARSFRFVILVTALLSVGFGLSAFAGQFQVLSNDVPVRLFGGGSREVPVLVRNGETEPHAAEIRYRLLQASSSTAARVRDGVWKKVSLASGVTVLESAPLELPAVRVETRFVIQWVEGEGKVIGKTPLQVFPANPLEALKPLAAGGGIGLFDPEAALAATLKAQSIEAAAVGEDSWGEFEGKIFVLMTPGLNAERTAKISESLKNLAAKGTGVVWVHPPPPGVMTPSFRTARSGSGLLVHALPEMVERFDRDPQSQSNLARLVALALNRSGADLSESGNP